MSSRLASSTLQCPYCGEFLEILIDYSVASQTYIEDCQVCCCPIEIFVEMDSQGEVASLQAKREND
ncbi:MAG: CPXCG motif-containing cysteine-rich protein [Pseudomonadota bacterium]